MNREPFSSETSGVQLDSTNSSYEPFTSMPPIQPQQRQQSNQTFIPNDSSTNSGQSDFTRFAKLDSAINNIFTRLDFFDKGFSKFYELEAKVNTINTKVSTIETDKKEVKEYLKKAHGLNKMVFMSITLIPIGFLFTLYYALKDYMIGAPDWLKSMFPVGLGVSAVINFVMMSIYVPKELDYIKKDIERMKNDN